MTVTSTERKAELVRHETSMSDIARRLGVSIGHVSQVVLGKRRSPTVERAVAEAIERPVEEVFEPLPSPAGIVS